MAPKRTRPVEASEESKRPKRAAAEAASANIKEQIKAERSSDLSSAIYASSSAGCAPGHVSSSGSVSKAVLKFATADSSQTVLISKLKAVPTELLDVQAPGQRRTPELYTASLPSRRSDGSFSFPGAPEFRPNLSPAEVFQSGSFGGYYFRAIASGITGMVHVDAWKEFPPEWFAGLKPETHVASPGKNARVNRYGVDCGQDLKEWEESAWIVKQDPFGWFQWYCRYFLGRRSPDDARQIARWAGVAGTKGRWKTNLIHKCVAAKAKFDDAGVSPVVRQLLQHWAYRLTEPDYEAYAKLVREGKKTSFISS